MTIGKGNAHLLSHNEKTGIKPTLGLALAIAKLDQQDDGWLGSADIG